MAKLIQAVVAFGPKMDLNKMAQLKEFAGWMSTRTGLNRSEVMI